MGQEGITPSFEIRLKSRWGFLLLGYSRRGAEAQGMEK
jgi:hypothetical protein